MITQNFYDNSGRPICIFPRFTRTLTILTVLLLSFTFMQNCIGRLISRHGLLAEVLVGLSETLHLTEASVEGHGGVSRVLCHIQVSRPAQLLLDYQRLLQQLYKKQRNTTCPVRYDKYTNSGGETW